MKVYVRTLGCRANQYDSEVVRAMLMAGGHDAVSTPTEADVAVFNSCAVTAAAEADLRKEIRAAARARPGLRTVVMGCATGRPEAGREIGTLPSVTHTIAGADLPAIAAAIGVDALDVARGVARQGGARALLRIQDGCDEHCTFCATTLARGGNRSRAPEALVEEASRLAEHHPEVVLTGVHIGSYGRDLGTCLSALVERLVGAVPGIRFRLSSIEATEVDDRLAELLVDGGAGLAPHLHAPLQSGSDAVLRRMGRHWYSAREYRRRVEALAARRGVLGLGADVIAGFPGETEADHRATLDTIDDLPFTYLHVFPYSARPGTAAPRLADQVPAAVVTERARELRAAGERKTVTYVTARAGGCADVVVVADAGKRQGVTEDYLVTRVPSLPSLPRGARYRAELSLDPKGLLASPSSR